MRALCVLMDNPERLGLNRCNSVLLFDSEDEAEGWLLKQLLARGEIIRLGDGTYRLDGCSTCDTSDTRLILSAWQDSCLGISEYAHIYDVHDMRTSVPTSVVE